MEGNDIIYYCVNYILVLFEFVVFFSSKKGLVIGLVVDWLNIFNFFDSKFNEDFFF